MLYVGLISNGFIEKYCSSQGALYYTTIIKMTTAQDVIARSKELRAQAQAIYEVHGESTLNLVGAAHVYLQLEVLKPPLIALASNKVTDVKIRAGGEEHRVRDAQASLQRVATTSASVFNDASKAKLSCAPRMLDALRASFRLDQELMGFRGELFSDSGNANYDRDVFMCEIIPFVNTYKA